MICFFFFFSLFGFFFSLLRHMESFHPQLDTHGLDAHLPRLIIPIKNDEISASRRVGVISPD